MHKRLVSNSRIYRFFIIPWVVMLCYINLPLLFNLNKPKDNGSLILQLAVSLVFAIIGYFFFRFFDREKIIAYDSEYLYIKSKNMDEKIPLINILSMKMKPFHLNKMYRWKLVYKEGNGLEKSVSFFPRAFYVNFQEFRELILKKNATADVQKLFYGPFQVDKATN